MSLSHLPGKRLTDHAETTCQRTLLLSRDYLTCDVYAYRLRDLVSHVTSNENGANEVKMHKRRRLVT